MTSVSARLHLRALSLLLLPALLCGAASANPAAAEPAPPRSRVLVLALERNNVEPAVANVVEAALVQALADRRGVEVISAEDLKQLAELEAGRQATGCDTTSCLAEIAGAMGARYVVFGSLTKVDDLHLANLSLFDAEQAKPIERATLRGALVRELLDGVPATADRLLAPLGVSPRAAAPQAEAEPAGSLLFPIGVGTAGTGAVVLGAGVAALVGAIMVRQDPTAAKDSKNGAEWVLPVGVVAGGLGAMALAVGSGVALWGALE